MGSRARLSSRPPHQCKRRRLQFMKLVANFNLRATAQINSNAYQSIFRPSKIRNRWRQARKSESSPQRVDTERSHSKCTLFFPSVGNTEYWSGYYNNNKVCEQRDQKKQQAQRKSWDLMVNGECVSAPRLKYLCYKIHKLIKSTLLALKKNFWCA